MTKLIAIAGLKNAGKTESSIMLQFLLNSPKIFHNYTCYKLFKGWKGRWVLTSFAYPLKRTLSALLDIPLKKFEDRKFKEGFYIRFVDLKTSKDSVIKLNDSKFNRLLNNQDYETLRNSFVSIRQLMQWFGSQTMRGVYGDSLWVLLTLKRPYTIVSDLRFRVEEQAVHKNGGKIIYIDNPYCSAGNHASEQEVLEMNSLCKFDYTIINDGTLKDLFNNLKCCIKKLNI